ncbi:hypothetical protein GQ44DRAFT_602528 [Phaeosphaeriaceae sp. PMI808]|nr:hypothetical protein GQ44DRAFT_602528 [Phaeosphaeriaceae sp. PMI808]
MAIINPFEVPKSAQELALPDDPNASFLILYIASVDPETSQPWCSDVRAALPVINKIFSDSSAPSVHYVHVGLKAEYKNPINQFRICWNINCVPALVRYERVGGEVKEVGRLVEGELLDEKRIYNLIGQ